MLRVFFASGDALAGVWSMHTAQQVRFPAGRPLDLGTPDCHAEAPMPDGKPDGPLPGTGCTP